jgi:5,10-methylenetetrahydromethanopterin reductase
VQRLIGGEMVELPFEGQDRKIRFLSPDIGVVNMRDPIPLHISALGPRGRTLTATLGAHWINATGPMEAASTSIAAMQQAWHASGVDPVSRIATAFCGGCVLAPGEPFDSPRAKAQAGPHATITLHNLVELEQFGSLGRTVPPALMHLLDRYRAIYQTYEPAGARYLENHRGHLMFLRPEEQALCTAELIRAVTLTDTKSALQGRVRQLRDVGYNHLSVHIRHGHPGMLEDWADVFAGV